MLSEFELEEIMSKLTLDDKIKLISGESSWRTHGIEHANIPVLKVSDGPNGVRGDGGVAAACFPVGVCMASTWNLPLLGRIGKAIAEEAIAKSVHVVLGPTINIHRTPVGGRNFECFSEDPVLSGELAAAYTNGLQDEGIGACPKHYVCNDSEFERHTLSVEVDERTLREIYLRPFEIAIEKSQPWTIMAAYNRINGIYACSHDELVNKVLKEEWRFDGLVISDWYAAKETVENAKGGLDLEMPGPAIAFGAALKAAIDRNEVDPSLLEDKVARLLRTINRAGCFENPEIDPETAVDSEDHRKVAYDAAAEGMVLLKNNGLLPLESSTIKSLAIIGPNSEDFRIMGGGSSSLKPHYISDPIESLEKALPNAELHQHFGCLIHKYLPAPKPNLLRPEEGSNQAGLKCLFLDDFEKNNVINERIVSTNTIYAGNPFTPGISAKALRVSGFYKAETTGEHEFALLSTGQSRLSLNGKTIIDSWSTDNRETGDAFFQQSDKEKHQKVFIEAGDSVEILIEFKHLPKNSFRVLRYGILPPQLSNPIDDAVNLAKQADVVILMTGTNDDWETEGNDRESLDLPGQQNELIQEVLKANKKTIIVNNSGSPISMPWIKEAPAVLQSWFAGQEYGQVISDILLGKINPSGRLPITFPKRLSDTPAFTSYPGEFGKVQYGEGIFVGYRWYTTRQIDCLFPFGHGLSYTQFSYDEIKFENREVQITLSNTGEIAGKECIQIYLHSPDSAVSQPQIKLVGFMKVDLSAGEQKEFSISLDSKAFSYWHAGRHAWVEEAKTYRLSAASSSLCHHLCLDVEIT